jgi:8-oxo-dGTP pyrophosphatase MutT (NUDIX family)
MLTANLFKTAQALVLQPFYRQVRGLTIGTRTMVLRDENEVLLVRHTYAPGWLLPGGGVERRETIYQAAVREVQEEAAITATEEPLLHGVFLNDKNFPGDHVACFVLRRFTATPFTRNLEIAEATFFGLDALPDDTTAGTRRRIREVVHGAALTRTW